MQKAMFMGVLLHAFVGACADEFPIGCWTFMTQERQRPVEQVVKDWKDLGITHPMSPIFGLDSDKAVMHYMLDLCDKEGLHLIVHDDRVHLIGAYRAKIEQDDSAYRTNVLAAVADWGRHPSFAGFHLYDEPRKQHNAAVFKAARIVRDAVPGKMCFLNLLPWYDWIHKFTGATECAPYLDMMAKETGLDMLCYDLYDHMAEGEFGETKGLDYYFENLREWMEFTIRNPGKRFWVTELCASHASRVVGDQSDYRWQISTAAAMGAKGITWYYPDYVPRPSETLSNVRNTPINVFGERTEYFERLSVENRLFRKWFGSEFMRLTIDKAAMVNMERGGIKRFAGDKDVLSVESGKKATLVTFFHDADGVRYLALVNLERCLSSYISVVVADGIVPMQLSYYGTYEKKGITADPVLAQRYGMPRAGKFACHMAPGQLALVKLGRK